MGLNPVFASHVKINRQRIMQGSWQRPLVRLQGLFWWRNDLAIYLGGVGRSDIPPSVGLGESVSKQALMGTEKSMPGLYNCLLVTDVQLDTATHWKFLASD